MSTNVRQYDVAPEQLEELLVPALSKAILGDYAEVLQIDPAATTVTSAETDGQLWFVSLVQTVGEVPVYGTEIGYTVDQEGSLIALGADAYPSVKAPTSPTVPQPRALKITQEAFGANSAEVRQEGKLVIFPDREEKNTFHLTWQIELFSLNPLKNVVYFVDARSGRIVHEFSNLRHNVSHEALRGSTERDGRLPKSHAHIEQGQMPSTSIAPEAAGTVTLRGRITGSYFPEHDYDNTVNTGYATKDMIVYDYAGRSVGRTSANANGDYSLRLSLPYSRYYLTIPLQTSWAQVRDGGNDPVSEVYSFLPSGTIQTDHNWNAGDASNVRYHVDRAHDIYKGSLFNYSGMDYQMRAYIDQGAGINGQADGTNIFFGSAGGEEWALSSDVIYHEYTHNAINRVYGGWIGNPGEDTQASAMDEGLSDYFACTVNDDPILGESVGVSRNLDNNTLYWIANLGAHRNGQVIGGAVWDVRQAVGKTIADRLFFKALRITPRARNFEDYGYNMVLADWQYYNGSHESQIQQAFANHRISVPSPALSVGLAGPAYLNNGDQGTWTANISYGSGSKTFKWYHNGSLRRTRTTSSNTDSHTDYGWESFTLRVDVTNNGESASRSFYVYVAGEGCGDNQILCQRLAEGLPEGLPEKFALEGNFPNPFGSTTQIKFALPETVPVTLVVYDALGREVARPVNRQLNAGYHVTTFEAKDLPSGVYVYRFRAGDTFAETGKMVIVK